MNTFTCHICGSHEAETKLISETFEIRGETVLIEHIPAKVCRQCGEVIFDLDTAIQSLVERLGRDDPETVKLTGIYHNLIRFWAEV